MVRDNLGQPENIKKFFIYGAGELGKQTYMRLKANKINIFAFLDKKATGKVDGTPILSPYDETIDKKEREAAIVIICLNAGNEHRQVADDLYHYGYKKIVFLPLNYAMSYDKKIQLTQLYNRAIAGEDILSDIRPYDEYACLKLNDDAVIRENEEWVWVWINQEILFSEDYFQWKGDKKKIHLVNDGIDVNLNAYCWYHQLFDYIDGIGTDCQKYLSIFGMVSGTKKSINKIYDREKLVADLNQKLLYGLEFFVEAASQAVWNSKAYFNLVGGHHRTIFLQHKGYVFYPIKLQKNDYKIWKNEQCLQETIQYITKMNIKNTYVPIPHPNFMNFPYLREGWGTTVLGDILRYLGPVRLEGKKIIDVSQYEGYFARMAKRMCADKVLFYNYDKKVLYLAEKIFRLLKLKDIEVMENIDLLINELDNADILFSMLNTKEMIKNNCLKNFSGKLFSEFCKEEDNNFIDMVISCTKMKQYKVLHREVFDGKMLEMGVFET